MWIRILTARLETGEPYILFIDTVNKMQPQHHRLAGLNVKTSNLCSEITLPTGIDHHGNQRTAVCCLSSLNLARYDEWKDKEDFIPNIMRFLDNVLTDFIQRAPKSMENARYSAERERSVGLGVMGFHSFLQERSIPFDSVMSKAWTRKILSIYNRAWKPVLRHLLKSVVLVQMLKNMDFRKDFHTKQPLLLRLLFLLFVRGHPLGLIRG